MKSSLLSSCLAGVRQGCERPGVRALGQLLLSLWLTVSCPMSGAAGESVAATEYELKAAFLFNFAKYVEWPASKFTATQTPIRLCIVGDPAFADQVEHVVAGKTINQRPFRVQSLRAGDRVEDCHMVFISNSQRRRLSQILQQLRGTGTLTVGDEIREFCHEGGMINFVKENRKMRFEINHAAAERERIVMSSKLLKLALPTWR